MALAQRTDSPAASLTPAATNRPALAMVTTLFFMWGLLTSLNDILIPLFKSLFNLNYFEAMLVQFCFFAAYFVFSAPSSRLTDWAGYKRAMIVGILIMAAGCFLVVPAAGIPSFLFFLVALVILATGMTVLQVCANPYVAILGPEKTAASRLNLSQAFNSLGTTVGPWLGKHLILISIPLTLAELAHLAPEALRDYRLHQAAPIKPPYLFFGFLLVLLALAFVLFKLPTVASVDRSAGAKVENDSIWRHRHLILGAIGIFVYVGAEVSIGSFLVNYFSQPDIGHISESVAAGFVSFYWGGAMVGRFLGSGLQQKIAPNKILGVCAVMAALLVLSTMLTFGHVAMWTIIAVGLFNSIMFPTIFTLSIEGLGPLTGDGSGLLVAAILGGAIIPPIQGALADRMGIHHAFFLPILCYIYIAYFAFRGFRHN